MAKTFRTLMQEVAEPNGVDERRFKRKHKVQKIDKTAAGEHVFKGGTEKDKSKPTKRSKEEEERVYESLSPAARVGARVAAKRSQEAVEEAYKPGDKVKVVNPHEDRNGESGTVKSVKEGTQSVKFKDGKIDTFSEEELKAESFELELEDGSLVEMTQEDITAINELSEGLNEENREIMESRALNDVDSFYGVLQFAKDFK